MLRIKEMAESLRLIAQVAELVAAGSRRSLGGPAVVAGGSLDFGAAHAKFSSMEGLIAHFREYSEGMAVGRGLTYRPLESPKGELGVVVVADETPRPYRINVRSPVAHNMHMLPSVAVGATFADFVATFCSFDIVLGEVDR